jgi:hypothetical protein
VVADERLPGRALSGVKRGQIFVNFRKFHVKNGEFVKICKKCKNSHFFTIFGEKQQKFFKDPFLKGRLSLFF